MKRQLSWSLLGSSSAIAVAVIANALPVRQAAPNNADAPATAHVLFDLDAAFLPAQAIVTVGALPSAQGAILMSPEELMLAAQSPAKPAGQELFYQVDIAASNSVAQSGQLAATARFHF